MNETIRIPVKASLVITLGDRTVDLFTGEAVARSPRSRFDRSADGVVTDRETGLMWSAETIGDDPVNWEHAKKLVSELWIGGFKDWRLPTIKELLSLVDFERHDPAIDTDAFECASAYYWSLSPWAPSPAVNAWIVNFSSAVPTAATARVCVRCGRSRAPVSNRPIGRLLWRSK